MHPILLEFGPITIHSYGFFIALAFLAGMTWTMREANQRDLPAKYVPDFSFYIILGSIIGARILYVLLNPTYFLKNPLEAVMFWKGGLVFLGGAIVATLLGYLFLRKKNQPVWPWLDALAPGLALGQAIGRLGCVFAGCCYGQTCNLPWAVTFTAPESLAPVHVPLHPTQIYHSLAGLITFALLLVLKKRTTEPGKLMGAFLILYSVFRFNIEFFRGDYRGDLGILSVTQLLAAGIFILGVTIVASRKRT
ncbi:MAG: prolipoprotein diacylglyceryl transferase [Desulfonatronovibrionaceae bacterium]